MCVHIHARAHTYMAHIYGLKISSPLQPLLLMANYRTWPTYPYPGDRFVSSQMVMFHNVATYERSRSPEACFTMHGDRATCVFRYFKKLMHYPICWCRAVHKKQIFMNKASISEDWRIVDLFIKPYNCCYIITAKICKIPFRSVKWITCEKSTFDALSNV